jgi:hypothetical protein
MEEDEVDGNKPRSSDEASWGDELSLIIVIMGNNPTTKIPSPPFPLGRLSSGTAPTTSHSRTCQ